MFANILIHRIVLNENYLTNYTADIKLILTNNMAFVYDKDMSWLTKISLGKLYKSDACKYGK
jgi:hypothetical protein